MCGCFDFARGAENRQPLRFWQKPCVICQNQIYALLFTKLFLNPAVCV